MPAFKTLWSNHPNIKGDTPVLDKKVYENQCAINMGAAWLRSGMTISGYTGALSWEKDKPKYPIRAQELANWFASPYSHLPFKVQKFGGKEVFEKISGKTGIIFFHDYWGPGNQGDHIDLWNGSRLTHWISWLQIHARIGSIGINSDLRKAESIWYWAVP
ncbi:MAG: hypothetical protein DM484_04815 [Candidatus Methylumidiphilus alinenensis]|uniref:Type VI secretion system amidase effector protein Tae4 n=1 Tax=Candidatus Methylumidiphilus alinenensis TaxID=2202197 RepID=A0A2W4RUT0_9GAMM|nr:MAG: hypothetical protein DM484_04815 [Candidatus Methylumidiphilus alinenensis]